MTIRNTDKLLVGRGDSSYHVTFENSGVASKDNLDEHLHKTNGGTITGTVNQHGPVKFSDNGSVFFDDNTFINVYQNRKITFQTGAKSRLEIGQQGINFLKGKPVAFIGGDADAVILNVDTVGGVVSYNGIIEGDDSLVNKKYVDDAVSSAGGGDLSGYATTSYVEEALENINESGGTQGTGRKLGRWYMTYRSPANISSYDSGTIHRTNSDFHVSAKGFDPSGDGSTPDATEYFSSLSVGDTLYMRKDGGNEIEEVVLTKAEYDSSRKSFIFAPIPQTSDNGNYYFYDGEGPLGNVPDPSGEYIKHMGPGRPVSSSAVVTPDQVWALDTRGRKTSTSPANGAFFPFAWMKKNYPQMTGFSIAEGIGLTGVYDNNDSPKKIYDPTALTGGASVKAMTIDGVPGIGVWQGNQIYSNYSIRLFGIQVAFTY